MAKQLKKPAVTVDLDKFAGHDLPDLEQIDDTDKYLTQLSDDELVADVILIGVRSKSFKDWFQAHVGFVDELRGRLPPRGPNAIEVKQGHITTLYTWSEFCLNFFGVSDEWVRRQLNLYHCMQEDPTLGMGEEEEKPTKPTINPDEEMVEHTEHELLEVKAEKLELRSTKLHLELEALLQLLEKYGDRIPPAVNQYVKELKQRLAALNANKGEEPPAKGFDTDELLNEMEDVLDKSKSDEGDE